MSDEVVDMATGEVLEEGDTVLTAPAASSAPLATSPRPFGALRRAPTEDDLLAMEAAIMMGNYSKLDVSQRLQLVQRKCQEEGISILQRPYMWGEARGKLMLVSTKDRAAMLRAKHHISVAIKDQRLDLAAGVYIVHVSARTPDGREDEDIGVVPVVNIEKEIYPPTELSNAMMSAITKAKNRATYSLAGVSGTDETEVPTIPGARLIDGAGAGEGRSPRGVDVAGQVAEARAEGRPRLVDPNAGKVQMGDLAVARANRAEAQLQAREAAEVPIPRPAAPPPPSRANRDIEGGGPTMTHSENPPPPAAASPAPIKVPGGKRTPPKTPRAGGR